MIPRRILSLVLLTGILTSSIVPIRPVTSVSAQPADAETGGQDPAPLPPDGNYARGAFFIENVGQYDESARFKQFGGDQDLWLAEDGLWITMWEAEEPTQSAESPLREHLTSDMRPEATPHPGTAVHIAFVDANPHPRMEPFGRLDTHISYFIGSDPDQWHADVPVWRGVRYVDLYPGIDLVIGGVSLNSAKPESLDWRLVAEHGADISALKLRISGADTVHLSHMIETAGDSDRLTISRPRSLEITTERGDLRLPLLRLEADMQTAPALPWLTANSNNYTVSMPFSPTSMPEIQSPLASDDLLYSTFIGGSGSDYVEDIAIGFDGTAYIAGRTNSANFPVTSGAIDTSNSSWDAFVAQIDTESAGLIFATFLGGSNQDSASSIAVDLEGNAYVTGVTDTSGFPLTPGAYQTSPSGHQDVFVVKIAQYGSPLEYATLFGGADYDGANGIAIHNNEAYICGTTWSIDLPTTANAYDRTWGIGTDAFVARLSHDGRSLLYGSYLSGDNDERGLDITVDAQGALYAVGWTESADFPTSAGALYANLNGNRDGFLVKLDATDTNSQYATYLGGSNEDTVNSVAIDNTNNVYVGGDTRSVDYPPNLNGYDSTLGGFLDGYVLKISSSGNSPIYSTYLGGSSDESVRAITVDRSGMAYISGYTYSSDFPVTSDGFDKTLSPVWTDGFVAQLNADGSDLRYATYLGGSYADIAESIALHQTGRGIHDSGIAWVAGHTQGSDYPTTENAIDRTHNGDTDAVLTKLVLEPLAYPNALDFGSTATALTFSINPALPSDGWQIIGGETWLSLSQTSGVGTATITVTVDRSGLVAGDYQETLRPKIGGVETRMNLTLTADPPQITLLSPTDGSTVYQGGAQLVKAVVQADGQPATGATVGGAILLDTTSSAPFDLFDDGAHDDGAADDGIYAGWITLYGPLMMPTSGNPYVLTVTATTDGGTASESASMTLVRDSGAPEINVAVQGLTAPEFYAGQTLPVVVTLTYPDAADYPATDVTAKLVAPDLGVSTTSLTYVSPGTWTGDVLVPTDGLGWAYLDVRAAPPAGQGYVDGWGGTQLYVYHDALTITSHTEGTYPLFSTVPLSVCVTTAGIAGPAGLPVTGATINALITAPTEGDAGAFVEIADTGCFEGEMITTEAGTHTLTYRAEAAGYRTATHTSPLAVSTQRSTLADGLQDFGDNAIGYSAATQITVNHIAGDGDEFAKRLKHDEFEMAVDLVLGLTFNALEGVETAHSVAQEGWKFIQFHKAPGIGYVIDKLALSTSEAAFTIFADVMHETLTTGLSAIAADLAMTAPARYLGTAGKPDTVPDGNLQDYLTTEYEALISGDSNLVDGFARPLGDAADVVQQDIAANTTQTVAEAPVLTLAQEADYLQDLKQRTNASKWLSWGEITYRADLLFKAQDRREAQDDDWFADAIASLTGLGLKLTAGAVCDGPCIVATGLAETAVQASLNSAKIAEDQRMRDLALSLVHLGFDAQSLLWSNTRGGFAQILAKDTPSTPQGNLQGAQFFRTPKYLFWTGDSYADVTISNPGDGVAAMYTVKAYYRTSKGYLQLSQNLYDPASGDVLAGIELAPGESRSVRLYLKKGSEFDDGLPRADESVRLNLFAYTETGAYLVDAVPYVTYAPETTSTRLAATQTAIRYIPVGSAAPSTTISMARAAAERSLIRATDGISESIRYPVLSNAALDARGITHTLAIHLHNPWSRPLPTTISQTIPSGVTVVDAPNATLNSETLTWHRVLQPREHVVVHAILEAHSFSQEIPLPPAEMAFYLPEGQAVVVLPSDAATLSARLPLRGAAAAGRQATPGVVQTVSVNLANLDTSGPHTAVVTTTVRALDGQTVATATDSRIVTADGTASVDLTYAVADEGTYAVEVTLGQEGGEHRLLLQELIAKTAKVYLPLALCTYTPFIPQPPQQMVAIPAGFYYEGCDRDNTDESCEDDEQNLSLYHHEAFYIDRYPVTNAEYAACVVAGACTPPSSTASATRDAYYSNGTYADYPVVHVSAYQAEDYCRWAGKEMPSTMDYVRAARGELDTRIYTWGDTPPTCTLANHTPAGGPCVGDTSRVGSLPAGVSPFGIMDMAGNVREWTDGILKVGGGWQDPAEELRVAARNPNPYNSPKGDAYTGFRCKKE